jgi:hypothetical protein
MAYTKTNWIARTGTNLNKFTKSAETGTSVILANTPDAVTQAGTPFSVENMNKIEQGIYDAHQKADGNYAALHRVGQLVSFLHAPSVAQMAAWRVLSLNGQIIQISPYQELCNFVYVGNANNATADWWYKTSDSAGNVRDVNGAYMRVLDHRGLFSRAAGQNSKYKMANDTPYDGKAIGSHIGDAIQNINGYFQFLIAGGTGGAFEESSTSAAMVAPVYNGDNLALKQISFLASRIARTANENRPVSISVLICITY